MPVSPGDELLLASGTPIFTVTAQGTLLDHLALGPRALQSWVPWYCNNSTALGSLQHTPSLSEKEAYLSRSFGLRGRLLVWHTFGAYRVAL